MEEINPLTGKFANVIIAGDFNYNTMDSTADNDFVSSVDHFLVSKGEEVFQYNS